MKGLRIDGLMINGITRCTYVADEEVSQWSNDYLSIIWVHYVELQRGETGYLERTHQLLLPRKRYVCGILFKHWHVHVCVCVCLHYSVGKRCCSTRWSTHIIKCAIFNYLTLLFNYYCPMHRASQCYKAWDEGERVPLHQEPSAKQKSSVQVQQQPLLCTISFPACYRQVTSKWLASD